MQIRIKSSRQINGILSVPGDKSISHRAVMFGALANGITEVDNFLNGADCLSTIACLRQMGINITSAASGRIIVEGRGLYGLREAQDILDTGNSGTTTRCCRLVPAHH